MTSIQEQLSSLASHSQNIIYADKYIIIYETRFQETIGQSYTEGKFTTVPDATKQGSTSKDNNPRI